jgi:tellurite resistance protein TehA-like permease
MEKSRPVTCRANAGAGMPGAGPAVFRASLRSGIKGLDPGYFALVMATGIVSAAVGAAGEVTLSAALLFLAIGCYLVLAAAYGWRLSRWRHDFAADATDPARAFAFFTFTAASAVLAARLAADGHHAWAIALLAAAVLAWLVLSYGLPLCLVTRRGARPALAGVNGTWFLWTVGTQSIVVAVTAFPPSLVTTLAPAAVALWAVGVVLYLVISGLLLACLLQFPAEPDRLSPTCWVFMGASAISVLAGARILGLPASALRVAVHPVVAGLSVILWAFGTWLIPLLIGLGAWRHLIHRVRLRYEPSLWSLAFPLGMYCVASRALGLALEVPWLVTAGHDATWIAFGVWALVFTAMLASLTRSFRRSGPADRAASA